MYVLVAYDVLTFHLLMYCKYVEVRFADDYESAV